MDTLFRSQEIAKLQQFANEIPTKYGAPVLAFIQEVQALRAKEAQEADPQPNKTTGAKKKTTTEPVISEPVLE